MADQENQITRGGVETLFDRTADGALVQDDGGAFNGDGVRVKDDDGKLLPFSKDEATGRLVPDANGTLGYTGKDLPKEEPTPASEAAKVQPPNDTQPVEEAARMFQGQRYTRQDDGSLRPDPQGNLDVEGKPIDEQAPPATT